MRQYDEKTSNRQIVGGIAVIFSTVITSLWAFWGIVENFHEGWYYESWVSNVGLTLAQYLSPMLIFMGVTLISIFWHRFGGGLHMILAVLAVRFFDGLNNTAVFLIILPLAGIGALYWFGHPRPRKVLISLAIGFPLFTLLISGISPAIRVSQRLDDKNLQARWVHGNGVDLTWAPDGPGWPREGANWNEAQEACQYLSEDGFTLASTPLYIWRLPTVGQVVRSMSRHGQNSGGVWDAETGMATYVLTPDKESPLWNVHSQVIYWWTATDVDRERAFVIVYDGKVWSRSKQFGPAYTGFRCVNNHELSP